MEKVYDGPWRYYNGQSPRSPIFETSASANPVHILRGSPLIALLRSPDRAPAETAPSVIVARRIFYTLLVALAATAAVAQDTESDSGSPTAVFSEKLNVRVLNVDVVVTDRSGKSIAGLRRDDFELRLDGKRMPISNFYSEAAATIAERPAREISFSEDRVSSLRPVEEVAIGNRRRSHVVILVDHTRLRPNTRKRAFGALAQAVSRLGKDDLVAVVGIEGTLVFYSDFLFDRQGVSRILDRLSRVSTRPDINEFERRRIFGELARGQSGGILARNTLADEQVLISRIYAYAVDEYSRNVKSLQQIETVVSTMAGIPGRKTLLYLGEGIATRPGEGLYVEWRNRFGSDNPDTPLGLRRVSINTDYTREVGRFDLTQPMRSLANAANRAGVTMYAIDAHGNHGGEVRSALTEQGATSETVSVVDENFREPLEYASKATGGRLLLSSGKLADQLVELVGGLRTFYSLGFVPPEDWQPGSDHKIDVKFLGSGRVSHRELVRLPAADEREASATVAALMYQTMANPLGVSATLADSSTLREDRRAAVLQVAIAIPIAKIAFLPQNDQQAASLSIFVSTKDAAGNPGRVQKIPFHLAIPQEFMEQALSDNAHYALPLIVRSGDQQVAIGVRDEVSGLFSAIRFDVGQFSDF